MGGDYFEKEGSKREENDTVLFYLGSTLSAVALILGRVSAARACGFIFGQPRVPDCMKEKDE